MTKQYTIKYFGRLQEEDGSAIVASILILAVLTLIGISATSTSTVELQIASNDQLHKIAFYNADSGIYGTPKLISNTINTGDVPTDPGIGYLPDADTTPDDEAFYDEVMGYSTHDTDNDVTFVPAGITVDIDIERRGQINMPGSGAEFASGAEGVGSGSAGGIAIFYGLAADGTSPRNSRSSLMAEYRKVVGSAGGL